LEKRRTETAFNRSRRKIGNHRKILRGAKVGRAFLRRIGSGQGNVDRRLQTDSRVIENALRAMKPKAEVIVPEYKQAVEI